jgi:hypothetical protein
VGPSGAVVVLRSWQTIGSTVGAGAVVVAALTLAAGTAIAKEAVTAARAARGF